MLAYKILKIGILYLSLLVVGCVHTETETKTDIDKDLEINNDAEIIEYWSI